MENTTIRVYLDYRFAGRHDMQAAPELLRAHGLEGKLGNTVNGELYAELFFVRMGTPMLEEATDAFLARALPCTDALNALAEQEGGEYTLEIVPEFFVSEAPSLALGAPMLAFLRAVKALQCVDIDIYPLERAHKTKKVS